MPHRLRNLGIRSYRPGFYDDPAFLAAEAIDPTLIEAYAGYVDALEFDSSYLEYARARVRETTSFLHAKLEEDGRRGACVDLGLVLGRFLERQGVWNYALRGAVTITFPASTRLAPFRMRPRGGVPGHVWLRVPPFEVVDLTIALQEYHGDEERHLPRSIIDETPRVVDAEVGDLVDEKDRAAIAAQLGHAPSLAELNELSAHRRARETTHAGVTIRYVPTGMTALDGDLERAKNLVLSGKRPATLWTEFVAAFKPPTQHTH